MRKEISGSGFSLVEVMIGSSIILIGFFALISAFNGYLRIASANANTLQASLLAEEGIEAVRLLRDNGYAANISALSNDTNYYLSWNGSGWVATTTRILVDSLYERKFVLSAVNRDNATDRISTAASGVTVDTHARKATVTVSWLNQSRATTTVSLATYVTDIFSN